LLITAVAVLLASRGGSAKILLGRRSAEGLERHVAGGVADGSRANGFTRTTSTLQLHEFIAALKLKSEQLHVVNMFTSPMRKVAPAIVIANPRELSAAGPRVRQAGSLLLEYSIRRNPKRPKRC
jgi:hypothetical protein